MTFSPSAFATTSLFALALLVSGCGSDDGNGSDGVLAEAAPYVAAESGSVIFTDWNAIKEDFGGEDLTSDSSEEAQREFFLEVGDTASIYPSSSSFLTDQELTGVGPLDVDWEASALGEEDGTLTVYGVPDDYDFEAVEKALSDCGYSESEIDGGSLYEHGFAEPCGGGEVPLDGTGVPSPGLSSIALLPDDGVLIGSGDTEAVEAAAAADGSALSTAMDDLGPQLDDAVGGYLAFGEVPCDIASQIGSNATPQTIEELDGELGDLGDPYEALLVAYKGTGDDLTGEVVLDFAGSDEAEAQVDKRRDLFENVASPVTAAPYSDVFTLDSLEAQDDAVVFSLSPAEAGQPNQLLEAVQRNDLLFAAC